MPGAVAMVLRVTVVVGIALVAVWATKFITSKPATALVADGNAQTQPPKTAVTSPTPAASPKITESVAQAAARQRMEPAPRAAQAPVVTAPRPATVASPAPQPQPASSVASAPQQTAQPASSAVAALSAPPPKAAAPAPALAFAPVATAVSAPAAAAPPAPAPASQAATQPPVEPRIAAISPADQALDHPLPPERRSIRGGSSRQASAERPLAEGANPKCGLHVPAGYRVGWRIRGGKRTSCYIERIR
ncbi:MAG: hypothetical protein J0H41_20690 [Rhizobiales bacterium]|nr:hypothetical protein [Hyphomicrobiales bacterium]